MNATEPETTNSRPSASRAAFWCGWVMSALPGLMLAFSAGMKLMKPPGLAEGFAHLGIPVEHALGLGILELACAVVYLIPRTSVLGAILVTAYLGGAVATHVRVGDPCYAQVGLGVLVWGGLFLRDPRLRKLIPMRS